MTTPLGHFSFSGSRSTVGAPVPFPGRPGTSVNPYLQGQMVYESNSLGSMPANMVGVSPIMRIFEQKKRQLAAVASARAPVAPAPVVQPAQAVVQPGVKLAQGQAPSNKALQSVIASLGLSQTFPQAGGFTLSKDLSSNRGPAGPAVNFGPGKNPVFGP